MTTSPMHLVGFAPRLARAQRQDGEQGTDGIVLQPVLLRNNFVAPSSRKWRHVDLDFMSFHADIIYYYNNLLFY